MRAEFGRPCIWPRIAAEQSGRDRRHRDHPLIVDTGASAVTNSGTLEATNNGELFVASNVTNTRHLIANNGTAIFAGAVSGTGTATVQSAGSIEFGSTTTANTTFAAGANGTVTFDAASTLTGKLSITGFTLGDNYRPCRHQFQRQRPKLSLQSQRTECQ